MLFDKRAEHTSRPVIILFIIVFYSVLGVIYSSYGASINEYTDNDLSVEEEDRIAEDYEAEEEDRRGVVKFFKNIGVTFSNTPWWLNAVFFTPLTIFFTYLIIVAWINPS